MTNEKLVKSAEKNYHWSGQFIFIPVGTIFIVSAFLIMYFIWSPSGSVVAKIWSFLLMFIGSVLVFYRRKLIVSKFFVIEKSTYFGSFLKIKQHNVKNFVKIIVTKQAYPPGQLYSDPESSVDGCFVSFVPKQGGQELEVADFILCNGGSNIKAMKAKIKFAKELSQLTGLRVEYSQSVRKKISDDEIRNL